MEIKISRVDGSIVFDFEPKPIPVEMLVVADSSEEVHWEIKPQSSAPVPAAASGFAGVRVPANVAKAVGRAVESDAERYPKLSRIVYGQAPSGYREIVKATQLKPGQKYCVSVFGKAFDSASEFFTA